MKKSIVVGSVRFPLDEYAIGGNAILGIRGAGKTFLAKSIAEQMLDRGIPIVAFDPIGIWRHLRRAGPSNGKAFKIVVAGGAEPDLPLTPASAPEIVRAAIAENIPLVIDLYDPKLSKADWRKVVRECFRTLLYENKGVRHVFLEETAEFAPQRPTDGQTYAEVEKLVRMGGNASIGITLINQRAQEVNKAVLDLCDNLMLMRQRGSHAIDALTKWLDKLSPDFAKEIGRGMPKMAAGDVWVFEGEADDPVRTRCAPIRSFHPDRKRPELLEQAGPVANTGDFVKRMSGELEAFIERSKAEDPKHLQREVARLTRELEAAASSSTPPAEVTQLTGQIATLQGQLEESVRYTVGLEAALDSLQKCVEAASYALAPADQVERPTKPQLDLIAFEEAEQVAKRILHLGRGQPAKRTTPQLQARSAGPGDSSLGRGERKILIAIAQHGSVDKGQLTVLTGYKRESIRTYINRLRAAGYITRDWPASATDAGRAALGSDFEPLPTGAALLEHYYNKLGAGEVKCLRAIVDTYPAGLTKPEIERETGYKRESVRTYVNRLRAHRLVSLSDGVYEAMPELFD